MDKWDHDALPRMVDWYMRSGRSLSDDRRNIWVRALELAGVDPAVSPLTAPRSAPAVASPAAPAPADTTAAKERQL